MIAVCLRGEVANACLFNVLSPRCERFGVFVCLTARGRFQKVSE